VDAGYPAFDEIVRRLDALGYLHTGIHPTPS
jgi:hypothetical protein